MSKIRGRKLFFFSLFVLGLFIVSFQRVSAATSDAVIEFVPATDAPVIIDPTDPTQPFVPGPGDPTDPPTGETGPLTLDYVSSVDFGEQSIEAGTTVYESLTLRPFIQVTDRRGTGEGWIVTASASTFQTTADAGQEPVDSLPGAIISFSEGEVVSSGTSAQPTPNTQIALSTNNTAVEVVTASENTGLGSWIHRWFPSVTGSDTNDNITLEILGGSATTGQHTATITWTLTSAP